VTPTERAANRYLPAGRFAHGFAKGKMNGDPAYARVLELLTSEGTLVDVGCGEGHLLALAHETHPGLRLWGIDHDEARIATGRAALGEDAALHVGDARGADLPDATVIAVLDVLHYMPLEEQDATLTRLVDALVPGGTLLIRDGESGAGWRSAVTSLSERFAVGTGRHKGEGVWFRSRHEMLAALTDRGLLAEAEGCSDGTPFANVLYIAHLPQDEP